LVSPILTEVKRLAEDKVQLFSGEEFNVNREIGLNGFCDFLLSKSTTAYIIEAPVIVKVKIVGSSPLIMLITVLFCRVGTAHRPLSI
jgi:hypothetical protein